jgi:methyl coenzyme M reductase beta subunit
MEHKGGFRHVIHSMDCLGFAGEFHGIKIVDRRGEGLVIPFAPARLVCG